MTIYLGHHQIDQEGPGALKLFLESLNETSSNIFPLSSLGIEVCLAQSVSPTYLLFLALSECPGTTSPFPSFSTLNILKLLQSLLNLYLFFFTDCLDLGFVPAGLTWSGCFGEFDLSSGLASWQAFLESIQVLQKSSTVMIKLNLLFFHKTI